MTDPQRAPNQNLERELPLHVVWLGDGELLPFIGLLANAWYGMGHG